MISSTAVNSDYSDIATALTGSIAADGQTPITTPLKFPAGTASLPSHTFTVDLTTGMYLSGAGILGFSGGGISLLLVDSTKVGTTGNLATYGNGAVLNPVGGMIEFAGSTAPTGWLLCYGQSLLRSAYPELFTVIGTTFGSADGTHFNVPDARGRVGAGKDDMGGSAANRLTTAGSGVDGLTLGAVGGAQNVTLDSTMIQAHTHASPALTDPGHGHSLSEQVYASGTTSPAAGAGGALIKTVNASNNTTGISLAANTGSTGGGLPHNNVQPSIVLNKIIFAGRP